MTAVPTGPIQTNYAVRTAQLSNGQTWIELNVWTASGHNVYFMPAETADALAPALVEAAKQARAAILLPNNAGTVTPIRPGTLGLTPE